MMGKKEEYHELLDARLDEVQAKIDVLKAKAERAKAEQKVKYHAEIDKLREKHQHVRKKLHELRSASEGAWAEIKAGVDFAWEDLSDAVHRATRKFK